MVTLHDVQHHDLPAFFSRAERQLRRFTYDDAARRATLVITPSEYARGRAAEVLGLDRERVVAIHHGIDHDRFRPERDDTDARLGDLERPFVLYPANVWPHKNHERLLAAFGRLRTGGSSSSSQAARTGDCRRCRPNVRHLGYVEPDLMPALYRRATAVVFPSLYEGFGGPPLEAMACGCPVASSTRGSLAEVVGDACLQLDPESTDSILAAIERVTSDEGLRSELTRKGLERAARFSWTRAAEQYTEIYEARRNSARSQAFIESVNPHSSYLAVVPAYNEGETLVDVVRELQRHAPLFDVLVIDDGSTDGCGALAADVEATVVRHPFNLGIGGAVQCGFIYALENGYDYMAQIDGDGQHRADELNKLVRAMSEDPALDMVCGSRFMTKDREYPAPISRRTGIHIFAFLLSRILRQRVSDPTSGFRLYNRRGIALFARDYPHDYPEVEAVLMVHHHRLRMSEVPVKMRERGGGVSSIRSGKSAYYMIKVLLAVLVGLARVRPVPEPGDEAPVTAAGNI